MLETYKKLLADAEAGSFRGLTEELASSIVSVEQKREQAKQARISKRRL
jgi:hypothetical protein